MMKRFKLIVPVFVLGILFGACKNGTNNDASTENKKDTAPKTEQRIVSLNGAVTAIIAELGHGDDLVGRDVTSTYPEWVQDSIKDLGHVRSLTMESIVALHPTLVLASESDMNPEIKNKLEKSDINYKLFKRNFSVEGTKTLIKNVAEAIGSTKTKALIAQIDESLAKVEPLEKQPKVLFIYARGAGTMMVAGEETPMESIIKLAGGENAVKGIKNFKPLTTEALLNSNPDVILLFNSGLESLGGIEGLLKIPGVAQTKAGKNKAVIAMEGGLISNFGPRVGKAAYQLNQLLAPYAE